MCEASSGHCRTFVCPYHGWVYGADGSLRAARHMEAMPEFRREDHGLKQARVAVRFGLIFSMITIVAVEFLINFGGLGQLINELAERYDLAGTYAAIIFVILVSVIVFEITERIERWLRAA